MTDRARPSVTVTLTEPAVTPCLGIVFGSVAMVPFVGGVLAFWLAAEPWRGGALPQAAALLLLLGYASLEVLDPMAARKLEAPLDVARLRPAQMAIPVACLLGTIVVLIGR